MDMKTILIVLLAIVLIFAIIFLVTRKRTNKQNYNERQSDTNPQLEIKVEDIATLAAYVNTQKEQADAEQRLKDLKKAELKQKLEVFKQTKEELKDKLKAQIDAKEWKPLETVLNNADKGNVGIYILHNETKNKYYVGQAKQLYKRIRSHFAVEDIAKDYLNGDSIKFKILTSSELDADYRIDHIEKTGIDVFESNKYGYNKTSGNL